MEEAETAAAIGLMPPYWVARPYLAKYKSRPRQIVTEGLAVVGLPGLRKTVGATNPL